MRAFVAVPVPPDEAFARLVESLDRLGADLRTVQPTHLHFTLSFLGDMPDEDAPRLGEALDAALRGTPAFPLALHGVGAFPNARNPRVVWAGAHDEPRMRTLATAARRACAEAGHRGDDKPFKAHLTLARTRSPRGLDRLTRFLEAHRDEALPTIPVDRVRLYRSHLTPQGAQYETVHETLLEG